MTTRTDDGADDGIDVTATDESRNIELRGPDLRKRSVVGVRWTSAQTAIVAVIGPLAQVVKARFLDPVELGSIAVLMIVYGFMITIENAGLGQAIVQRATLDSGDRFTYLSVAVIMGLLGSTALVLLAPVVERAFSVPGSAGLIRLVGPVFLLSMLCQFLRSLLQREMLFRPVAAIQISRSLVNVLALSCLLLCGCGPMSVPYSLVLSSVVSTIALVWAATRRRVLLLSPKWKPSVLKHLWNYGGPIAAKQLFTYISHRSDEVVVAIALPPDVLGVYHLAKETLQKLQVLITSSFAGVLLSLFSRIRDDRERLTRVYQRITLVVSYVGITVFVGVALTANDIVPAVFGAEWTPAVPAFRALALGLIPIVLTANISSSLLYSLGKSRAVLMAEIALNLPYFATLLVLRGHGLAGILPTYVVYCYLKGLTLQMMANAQLPLTLRKQLLIYVRASIRVAGMVICVLLASWLVRPIASAGGRSLVLVAAGVCSMIAVTWLSDRQAIRELISIVARR